MDKEQVVENGKTDLNDDDVLFGIKEPRSSCKHCHGTGRMAYQTNGDPVLCRCMSRNGAGDWITIGQFRQISNSKWGKPYEGLSDDTGDDKVHTSESTNESKET